MNNAHAQNVKLGVLLALSASLCNTVMSVFVKLLGDGQSIATIVFARFAIGLLVLLPWFLTDKNLFKISKPMGVLMRCVTSIMAMVCVFYSLKYMPVANVLLLNNTFPLFLPVLSLVMLSIKTPPKMIVGIVIGFAGVALVLNPSASAFNWHALIALLSGLLAALAMLQIRLLVQGSSSQQILFCLFAFGTVASGIFVPFSFTMPTGHQFLLLFFVGLCGAGYQLFLTLALNYAKARVVSPIYFSSILFAAIFDWMIWSIKLTPIEYVGLGLIIAGGILTILMSGSTSSAATPGTVAH